MWALAAKEILKLLLAYLVPVASALQEDWKKELDKEREGLGKLFKLPPTSVL